jgi:excisionase family DNA binding protein
MPDSLMTAADVATWLKLNIETVYALIAKDQLPAIKVGGQWRFQEAQIRAWLGRHNAPARHPTDVKVVRPTPTSGKK